MKIHFLIRYTSWLLITLWLNSDSNAQKPVGPNGKFATINNVKLYYEDTGRGMPLLLLHGFGRTGSDWDYFKPEFSKSYRVITMDLPGHGRSDLMDTTDVYLHKKAAEYIIGLLDTLHIDSVNIMGISSGGFITLYIATLRPQLAKRIVIIGGQVYYSKTTRDVISSVADPDKNPRNENQIKTHGREKASLLARQFWNFRKLYGDPSFTPDVLATVKARTLIIHGDNDQIAPVSNAWEMYQHIPQARLWIVPNGGHVPPVIAGNENDFIRRALEFLQGKW
ncbi:MAG TPA: alpha/beta hydrolase [Chitinophagaceae bacterium]|nr:alpha/beta hydrolase [Chitinophagaceae bacterium]